MIDLTAKQLSWALIAAASIAGTAYFSLDGRVRRLEQDNAAIISRINAIDNRLASMEGLLIRMDGKLDKK